MDHLVRRFSSEAPAPSVFRDDKPTLLITWWCTFYAITIIFVRVSGRWIRAEKIFLEDGIMLVAITPLLLRLGFVHIVLVHGTNNTLTDGLSGDDIQSRVFGSQLVLASRIMYAAYIWAIKYSTSIFLRTLTESVWQRSHQTILRYLHVFLAVTFFAVVVSDLAACQPFNHYWQVVPDPGPQCRQGYAYLFTMGICNILTNLALILFPMPMILKSRLSAMRKTSIIIRLALPVISIGVVLYALPHVVRRHSFQPYRSLMASVDILIATFTSNAVVLSSLLQDRGYKKTKYKPSAATRVNVKGASVAGKSSLRNDRWGSDEDLMGDVEGGKAVVEIRLANLGEGDGHPERKRTLKEPHKVKLQEIRVDSTWEISEGRS